MADTPISGYPAASSVAEADLVVIVQGGANKKATATLVRQRPAGTGTGVAKPGGVIFDHITDGASTHTDGTVDNLYDDTIPANTLAANSQKLLFEYAIAVSSAATAAETIKLSFAGTAVTLLNGVLFSAAGKAIVRGTIYRTSATAVLYAIEIVTAGVVIPAFQGAITSIDLTATNHLILQGATSGAGAAAGDVTAKCGWVEWRPAA